ncbi:MAG: DUF4062 domain-containing protein [Chloroflexi bacterium]|nr:DUF4062 domain-containing protein [Chloroflexota bacterium]
MKVFLSSTYTDLIEHRKSVVNALEYIDLTGFQRTTAERAAFDSQELRLTQVTMKPVRSGTRIL